MNIILLLNIISAVALIAVVFLFKTCEDTLKDIRKALDRPLPAGGNVKEQPAPGKSGGRITFTERPPRKRERPNSKPHGAD